MEGQALTAFAIHEKFNGLRTKAPLATKADYDSLKQGDVFAFTMECPACGNTIFGIKEKDSECQHCHLIFRYQKR